MLLNLEDKGTFIQIGPANLVVNVKKNGKNLKEAEEGCVEKIKEIFAELTMFKDMLKLKACYLNLNNKKIPDVIFKTVSSAKFIDEKELTPMSAVAGAVAETVLEWIKDKFEYETITVNNGGDIAIDFNDRISLQVANLKKFLIVNNSIKGIATSGFGGISLSKGIADNVTVFAKSASIADAAATLIANNVRLEKCNSVDYCFAEEIIDNCDIEGELVVKDIKKISDNEIIYALKNGLRYAEKLVNDNKIFGAILNKGKFYYFTRGLKNFIREV